jgi:hypothetical protein
MKPLYMLLIVFVFTLVVGFVVVFKLDTTESVASSAGSQAAIPLNKPDTKDICLSGFDGLRSGEKKQCLANFDFSRCENDSDNLVTQEQRWCAWKPGNTERGTGAQY